MNKSAKAKHKFCNLNFVFASKNSENGGTKITNSALSAALKQTAPTHIAASNF